MKTISLPFRPSLETSYKLRVTSYELQVADQVVRGAMKKAVTQKEGLRLAMKDLESDPRKMLIVERTAAFADRIIQLSLALPHNAVGWEIGRQIVRAGMSVGANVEESQAAESRADFIHKLRIARKECREAHFFLKRIEIAELVPRSRLRSIKSEAEQIVRILTSIILKSENSAARTSNGSLVTRNL